MKKYKFILLIFISCITVAQNTNDDSEKYMKELKLELISKNIDDFFIIKYINYGVININNIYDKDYCETKEVNYRMYAFWEENKIFWLKVFDNCGGFNPIKLKDGRVMEFYNNNFENIKKEEVNKYKTKPDSIINGKKYSFVSSQSHSELRYFTFYKDSTTFKKFIDMYDLTSNKDSPNISYEINKNISLTKLEMICEEIINEYTKTESLLRLK